MERGIEAEHVPAAREFGLAVQPWSPLGGGFLTGKYRRKDVAGRRPIAGGLPGAAARPGEEAGDGAGRLGGANPFGDSKFTERNWQILEAVRSVADEAQRSPAQVAIAWTLQRPSVAGLLIGASRVEQLRENVAALEIHLSPGQLQKLDEASAPEPSYPSSLFTPAIGRYVFGGSAVPAWRP